MCGFLGWFSRQASPWSEVERSRQRVTLEAMRHRGPDDGHEAEGDGWWMGFRRLAILDLSEAGRQPMRFGASGRFTLAFNGEIYNFRSLREQLGQREFHSSGDSEVLGALLESRDVEQVLGELRGMFAFAWWDAEKRALIAARDHFGIKPLYYRHAENGDLWLGSELRSVCGLSGVNAEVSRPALAQFLRWGAVQAPDTMIQGVQCLPPGHLMIWRDGRLEVKRYFKPAWPGRGDWTRGHRAQCRLVREAVLDSVQAHLVADVPVGVFLSGGLDSTLMAACMRELGQTEIQAFSIGYEEGAGVPDESDAAERTAAHFGCRFVRERLSAEGLAAQLDDYFEHLDQPTGDALNTFLVSRVAAQHVKVTLSGLGADEWFGGYNYHRLALLAARSPLSKAAIGRVTGAGLRLVEAFLPAGARGATSWKTLLYAGGGSGNSPEEWQAHGRSVLQPGEVARLLGGVESEVQRWSEDTPLRQTLLHELADRAPDAWLHQLLLLETETYLANTLLRDNDATSMAHSLELRVPLVDRRIFELAGRLPPESKLALRSGKRILREAFRDLLPPWIYEDRQKKTFTLPLMKWMRQPQWRERIEDTLRSTACRNRGWIDATHAERAMDRYFRSAVETKAGWKLSQTVWMLFVLESWARTHVDR